MRDHIEFLKAMKRFYGREFELLFEALTAAVKPTWTVSVTAMSHARVWLKRPARAILSPRIAAENSTSLPACRVLPDAMSMAPPNAATR